MSRSRSALWTAAVLLLGAGAWWLLGRAADREVLPEGPPAEVAPAAALESAPAARAARPAATGPSPPTSARALRGEVLREDGSPAGGATVTALPLAASFAGEDAPEAPRRADADASGRFAFEDVPAGSFGVHARLPGAGAASLPFVRVGATGDTTVTLRLSGDRGIAGRVEDLEGRPVPGARVSADGFAGMRRLYRGLFGEELRPAIDVAATTGPDGAFLLPALEPAPHAVVVVASGFLRATVGDVPVPTANLVVRLVPGATVRGVVTVAAPAPPATVRVWTEPASVEAEPALAEGEAAFVLDGLKPGAYRVLASAVGCTRAAARIEARAGEAAEPVRLALTAGTPISGSVRSRDDGAAVPEAEVALAFVERRGNGWSSRIESRVRTDGRGAWSARLRPGEWLASASKAGWSAPEAAEEPPPLVVGGDPVTVDLVLVPSPAITGEVRFADGAPVEGAHVWIASMGTNPDAVTSGPIGISADDDVSTDAEGRFRIEGVATYGRYALAASGPGGATATVKDVVFEAGATTTHTRITIQRVAATGARVEGRVVDERGDPVAGAIVRFAGASSLTSADGAFVREAAPAGTFRARYGAVGRALGFSPPFTVGSRATVRLPPWTLPREGVLVRGTVRTSGGRPVSDASVTVWFPLGDDFQVSSVATGADGRYVAEGPALSEGSLTIQARAEGLQFAEARRGLPMTEEVDFVLGGYATAVASISFAGAPVRVEAALVAEGHDDPVAWIRPAWDADASTLRVGGIVAGRRRLRFVAPGYAPIMTEAFDAREGETIALGARRFTAGATFAGRILDADGKPVAGAQVNLVEPFQYVDTDAEGRFRIEHVPPGTWKVGIFGAPGRDAPPPPFTATFVEGRTLEVERRLPR